MIRCRPVLVRLGALLAAMLLAAAGGVAAETAMEHAARHAEPGFTCPMHPQIRSDEPGTCPICGMRLVAMERHVGEAGRVALTPHQQAVLDVQTAPAVTRALHRELRTVAEVTWDDRNLVEVTARVNGEVATYTRFFEGDRVAEGETLIHLRSPELMRVVEDYAQAMRAQGWVERLGSDMPHINATSTVTLLWRGLTEEDIRHVAKTGEVLEELAIRSPVDGVVVEQNVNHGSLVNAGVQGGQFTAVGETIVKVADLATMWVQAELLGPDLERVEVGDRARVRVPGLPGRVYEAKVSFVYPEVDRERRTRIARLVLPNEDLALVPGMYAHVTFLLPVAGDPAPPPHRQDGGAPATGETREGDGGNGVLAIPRAAVIATGEGSRVFVKSGEGVYTLRPVELGEPAGDAVPVLAGLHPGEEVVVQGQFFLNAEVALRTSRGGGGHRH